MLTTRKGNKRFAFYDLKLSLAWEAAPASGAGEPAAPHAADEEAEEEGDGEPSGGRGGDKAAPVSGEISVAEFGSGSDHDDIEVSVSTSGQCAPFALQPNGLGSALRMLRRLPVALLPAGDGRSCRRLLASLQVPPQLSLSLARPPCSSAVSGTLTWALPCR